MNCYIRIKDGVPFEHPILEMNFKKSFPEINVNNLPPEFAKFERVQKPNLGVYEVYEGVTYEWDNGIVKDVHHIRPMTAEEKIEKQNQTKASWAESGYLSWTFNEETCSFDPPIPEPKDGLLYDWDEETQSWLLVRDIVPLEENLEKLVKS